MPQTVLDGPQAVFENGLRDGRFMLQRNRSTGEYVFYPRVLAPGSGETDLEWVEAGGLGSIYAITVNRSHGEKYNIALIDLAEGPRMMSAVVDCETAPIGAAVRAEIELRGGSPRIVFRLIEKSDSA